MDLEIREVQCNMRKTELVLTATVDTRPITSISSAPSNTISSRSSSSIDCRCPGCIVQTCLIIVVFVLVL